MKFYFFKVDNKTKDNTYMFLFTSAMVPTLYYALSLGLCVSIFVFIILCFSIFCIAKGYKPKFGPSIGKYEGKKVDVKFLVDNYPELKRIGICGEAAVGKSTLIKGITQSSQDVPRTSELKAIIHKTRGQMFKYFALLDGPGQRTNSQLEVAKKSNLLIVLLDHNIENNQSKISNERIFENINFLTTIREGLEDHFEKPNEVHFVFNKHDLFKKNGEEEIEEFINRYIKVTDKWLGAIILGKNRYFHKMDSTFTDDVYNLMAKLNI